MVEVEQQTRDLVEGYDYLKHLSTQVPQSYSEMASFYREQMINAASIVAPLDSRIQDDTKENNPDRNLDFLRMELQSISHERVIVEVLTRQTVNQSKRQVSSAPSSSSRNITDYRATSSSVPPPLSTEMISIPEFNARNNATEVVKKPRGNSRIATTVRKLPPSAVMVPSVQRGSIPSELMGLKTTPTPAAPIIVERRARKPVKKPRADVAIQGFQQVVKSFKNQLLNSQSDLESLKAHIDSNLTSDKQSVQKQLKHILTEVKKQQEEQASEVVSQVDRAVDNAMGKLAQLIKPLAEQKMKAAQNEQHARQVAQRQKAEQEKLIKNQRKSWEMEYRKEREKEIAEDVRMRRSLEIAAPPPAVESVQQPTREVKSQDTYRIMVPRTKSQPYAQPSIKVSMPVVQPRTQASPRASTVAPQPAQSRSESEVKLPSQSSARPTTPIIRRDPPVETNTTEHSQLGVRLENQLSLVAGEKSVHWDITRKPITHLEPAPSMYDLLSIPGSNHVSHDSISKVAPQVIAASDDRADSQIGLLNRHLGVVAERKMLVIAGAERPRTMPWEEARSSVIRPKRDPLHTEDSTLGSAAVAREDEAAPVLYTIDMQRGNFLADGALEGTGQVFKGLNSFMSKVKLQSDDSKENETAATLAAASFAQERHMHKNFEKLIDTVVEGQKALISEVLSSQQQITQELVSNRREPIIYQAANPPPDTQLQQAVHEERIVKVIQDYLDKRVPVVDHIPTPHATPAAGGRVPSPASTPAAKDHHNETELDEKIRLAFSEALKKSEQDKAEAERRFKENERVMISLQEKLSSQLEDHVRRGVEEGIDEGVRRVTAGLESANQERQQQQEHYQNGPSEQTISAGLAFKRVPLPFMPSAVGEAEVLSAIQADTRESSAALEALKRGLGPKAYAPSERLAPKPKKIVQSGNDDIAWLDGEYFDEVLSGEMDVVESRPELAETAGLVMRPSFKLDPDEFSEYIDDREGDPVGMSWSASTDDGEAFILRNVNPKLLLSERGKYNLRRGGDEDDDFLDK